MADRYTVLHADDIADGAITENELNASVAGTGLIGGGGSALSLDFTELPVVSIDTSTDYFVYISDEEGTSSKQLVSAVVDAMAGDGLSQSGGALDINVDDSSIETTTDTLNVKALGITNAMLAGSIADGKLLQDYIQTSEVDDSSIEFSGGDLNVKALGITNAMLADDNILEAKLDVTNAPTDGYFLTFDNASGGFTWVESPATSGVQEADLANDDFTALLNGATTDFDLTDIPITASLQVFINGKLGIEGSGKDYEFNPDSGDTKTIRVSPALASTERLIAYYIKDN